MACERSSGNSSAEPPSRNLGVSGPPAIAAIVAAGARKEKLKERAWQPASPRAGPSPYAELRAASAFSFLDGASLPEDLVEEAARLGIPAVALVDTNGVYGAPRFYKAAKAAGLKALVGAEVTLAEIENRKTEIERVGKKPIPGSRFPIPGPRLTLLVENRAGYKNLCRLITAGALGKAKGETAVAWDQIAAHAEGLHCLTGGGEGVVARALVAG